MRALRQLIRVVWGIGPHSRYSSNQPDDARMRPSVRGLRDDRVVLPDLRPQKAYECRVRALTLEGYSVFTDASEAMVTGRRY
mgnify:CR=1 FL=1